MKLSVLQALEWIAEPISDHERYRLFVVRAENLAREIEKYLGPDAGVLVDLRRKVVRGFGVLRP